MAITVATQPCLDVTVVTQTPAPLASQSVRTCLNTEVISSDVPAFPNGYLTGDFFVKNDVFTGAINGSNTTFITTKDLTSPYVWVYLNGLLQKLGTDFTITAPNQIIFITAPSSDDSLIIDFLV